MSFKDRIREAREAKGLTQIQVAEAMDPPKTKQAVGLWEAGTSEPKFKETPQLAKILDVDAGWLLTGAGTIRNNVVTVESVKTRQIPIINYVQAGKFTEVMSPDTTVSTGEFVLADTEVSNRAFALKVVGHSMSPDFNDGDTIIVDPDETLVPGCMVIASINGDEEATFKKYRPRGKDSSGAEVVELAPLNEDYPTLTIDKDNPGKVVGRVVRHTRKL